jgi:hypothetical protein
VLRVSKPNRRLKFQKRNQLFIRAHVTARPLRDQTQSELGYRPLQFHKRSQLFIGAHDEPLAVIAVRSAIPITTRLKPKENPTEVLNLHRPMLPFASSDQFQTLFSNNF